MEQLLGNEPLKTRLHTVLQKDTLSHCYLLTGPEGSGKHTLARYLCAAMQCTAPARRPCGVCPQCHKVAQNIHPDVVTVDDPAKVTIPVKLVRDACADLFIRPNEGRRKIYLFPRAQALNVQGQNALLKCIEEPPPYGAFLLLAEHSEQLLPTIRSRCVELHLAPLAEPVLLRALRERFPDRAEEELRAAARRSDGYLGQAQRILSERISLFPQTTALVQALCGGGSTLSVLVPMEKMKRDALLDVLRQWQSLFSAALRTRSGFSAPDQESGRLAQTKTERSLLACIDAVRQAATMLEANVSPAHVCGVLEVQLR